MMSPDEFITGLVTHTECTIAIVVIIQRLINKQCKLTQEPREA